MAKEKKLIKKECPFCFTGYEQEKDKKYTCPVCKTVISKGSGYKPTCGKHPRSADAALATDLQYEGVAEYRAYRGR